MLNSRPHSQQIKMRNHHKKLSIVQPKLSQRLCLYRSRRCNTPGSTAVHRRCLGSSTKSKSVRTRQSFGKTLHNSTPRCPANTQTLARHSQANPYLKMYSMCQSHTVDNIRRDHEERVTEHFEYKLHGHTMASSYLTYQGGRPGYWESSIAGNSHFSSISRVHLRDPVAHPGCANHSTGSTLLKPIRALAGINGIVAGRSLSNQFTGQTGCPATSKGTFNSATILHRAELTGASESRVLPTRW